MKFKTILLSVLLPAAALASSTTPSFSVNAPTQGQVLSYSSSLGAFVNSSLSSLGSGTVTGVTGLNANGVAWSITNPNTTPRLSITLGAITPTTVNGLTISTTTGQLTIANGKSLTDLNNLTFAGVDGSTLTFQGTGTVVNRDSTDTLSSKTIDTAANTLQIASAPLSDLSGGSLTLSSGHLTLDGDSASPGVSKVYSTDGSGAKGWHDSTSAVTSVSGTANQITATAGGDGAVTLSLAGPHNFTTQTAHGVLLGAGTSAVSSSAAGAAGAPFLSGGSAANGAFAALNLAGGPSVISGTLPSGNGGAGGVSGLLKANGAGNVSAASSGTDYVAPATTVNGHALTGNVSVTATDVGLGSVLNVAQEPALGNPAGNNYAIVSSTVGGRSWVSGQGIAGLTTTSSPTFTGLNLTTLTASGTINTLTLSSITGSFSVTGGSGTPATLTVSATTNAPVIVSTIAALKAVTVTGLATGYSANVLGYYAAGDGSGGPFYYDSTSSATDNGGTIIQPTSGSGRWLRLLSGFLNLDWFGAYGDNSHDDTAAFTAAVAVINANGSGALRLTSGKTYCVMAIKNSTLFTFTSLGSLVIWGPGATIHDTQTYTGTDTADLFHFVTCANVYIYTNLKSQFYTVDKQGCNLLTFLQGCTNVNFNGTLTGGIFGFYCLKQHADPDSYRTKLVNVKMTATHTEYPVILGRSGDDATIDLEANSSGRNLFLYGVSSVRARVDSYNQGGATEISSLGGDGCSDIDLEHKDLASTIGSLSNEAIIVQFSDQTPAVMRNIRIKVDVLNAGVFGPTVGIYKLNNAGNNDPVGRGHVLDGLEISGYSKQYTNVLQMSQGGAFASPDVVSRINFHDLYLDSTGATGSNFACNLGALVDTAVFRNIYAPKSEVSGANGANGLVRMVGVTAINASPAGNASGTDVQEYVSCVFSNAAATSFTNKRWLNSTVAGIFYSANRGRGTNNDVEAGDIGEVMESVISQANAVSLSTGAQKTITSLVLTPGVWEVNAVGSVTWGATTVPSYFRTAISLTNNAIDTDYMASVVNTAFGVGQDTMLTICPRRVKVASGTTTVYLTQQCGFATSTAAGYGVLRAIRQN